jgi:hypothetical protein
MQERLVNQPQALIIGLGGVGSWVLELLARTEGITYVVGADLNQEWGRRKIYNVISGAILQGYYPRLEFVQVDLQDVDATAETIARLQPQLIFNCATLQTWWLRKKLPPETADRLSEAGSGPWLSTHLALSRKLMLAVRASDFQGHVINSGIPDISNAVLAKRGLAPTIGLGNIDLLISPLRMGVARRLDVPVCNVSVYAILHHYHTTHFRKHPRGAPSYFLRLMVGDRDVTGELDTDLLLHQVSQDRFSGPHGNAVVAASGVKNGLALLRDSGLLTHSPGPRGLPGGYPVRLSSAGAEVVLPTGVTMEQALAYAEAGQRADGVERIEQDGTVVYTDRAAQIVKQALGYELTSLGFDQCDEQAAELIAHFQALLGS